MNNILRDKKLLIILLISTLILSLNCITNFFSGMQEKIGIRDFQHFQDDSDNLVLSKIYLEKNMNSTKWGLTSFIGENKNMVWARYLLGKDNANIKIKENDYKSQVGLQGHIFSFLYNKLGIPVTALKILCGVLFSIVIVALCYNLARKYNKLLGIIFYIVFLLSPWTLAISNNLFWVSFLWFIPALFALILSRDYSKSHIYIPLIFISTFIKCLCGYDYISTVMLFTISFFLIDFIVSNDKQEKKKIFKTIIITGIACLLAFFSALLIHGYLRGDGNIVEGIKDIYQNDVVRRTLKLPGSENVDVVYRESINASILDVLLKYSTFTTNVILGIPKEYFRIFVFVSLVLAIYNLVKNKKDSKRDMAMFIIFLICTLSWLILGKAHSYIHTHINYVLFYFGFIQVCLYIIIKTIINGIIYISHNKKITENCI